MNRRHLLIAALVLLLWLAVQAGEYSTWDWRTLRRAEREEHALIERLRVEVDSLRREAVAVETDPGTQERLARELYGMLRPGEYLYTIERGADSGRGR